MCRRPPAAVQCVPRRSRRQYSSPCCCPVRPAFASFGPPKLEGPPCDREAELSRPNRSRRRTLRRARPRAVRRFPTLAFARPFFLRLLGKQSPTCLALSPQAGSTATRSRGSTFSPSPHLHTRPSEPDRSLAPRRRPLPHAQRDSRRSRLARTLRRPLVPLPWAQGRQVQLERLVRQHFLELRRAGLGRSQGWRRTRL